MLVSDYNEDFAVLQNVVTERAERKVQLSKTFRGQRARWLGLAAENASVNLQARGAARSQMNTRFTDLQNALSLPNPPKRLECNLITPFAEMPTELLMPYSAYKGYGVPRPAEPGSLPRLAHRPRAMEEFGSPGIKGGRAAE